MPNINKVVYGNNTLIDLTGTTATADKIMEGYGAFGRDGAWMDGNAVPEVIGDVYQDENNYVVLDNENGAQIIVDSLSVTQNGTYTAPTGYAYSPVTVNVSGGGGGDNNTVKFIDYDGTLLYSYTAQEFAQLSDLPRNPTHTGLVSQGWNWTKEQITAQLTAQPNSDINVGQMYITSSGKTEIDISLDDPELLTPYLKIGLNGTAIIDWGDNSQTDTVTGTSISLTSYTSHVYSSIGDYTITIEITNGSFQFTGNYILLDTNTSSDKAIRYNAKIINIRMGLGITSIGNYAFNNCYGLQTLTLPSGITTIMGYTFAYCLALKSLTIPAGVTSIGNYLCMNCNVLQSLSIPYGIISIGGSMVSSCFSLKSLTIPDSVTSIGTYAFSGCYSLHSSLTIPNGVTSIGNSTFNNCHSLLSLTIPDSVTSIGSSAFMNCQALQTLSISNNITSIGNNAFSGCSGLTSFSIADGVTSIGDGTFGSCTNLQSLTIPDSVTSIGSSAFSGCYSLQSLTIPDSVTSIGNNAFQNCSALQSLTLSNSITSIGVSVFSGCNVLKSLTIPAGVTSIGNYAFQNCYTLSSLTIPAGVTTIGNYAFQKCYSMYEYHFLSTTPPTLPNANVFSNIATDCKIYVPRASLEAYQTATYWSNFASRMVGE